MFKLYVYWFILNKSGQNMLSYLFIFPLKKITVFSISTG